MSTSEQIDPATVDRRVVRILASPNVQFALGYWIGGHGWESPVGDLLTASEQFRRYLIDEATPSGGQP